MGAEDHKFLTGEGCYSADVAAQGAAWAVVVRSPRAHADIFAIDIGESETAPGVLGVFTGTDLAADDLGHIPCLGSVEGKNGSGTIVPPHPALAIGRVYYVGEPVALVVAETQVQARDAAELVKVDYRDLPSVNETALAPITFIRSRNRVPAPVPPSSTDNSSKYGFGTIAGCPTR